MAKLPYLQKPSDRDSWLFRVRIPERLRPFAAAEEREFKRTLGPTYQEALLRYHAVAEEWTRYRAALQRAALAANVPVDANALPPVTYKALTSRERTLLDHFVNSWEYTSLDAHDSDVRDMDDEELAQHERDLQQHQATLQASLRRLAPPDWWVEDVEGQLADAMAIRLHPECPERRDFFLRVLDAELRALKLSLERLAGTAYHPTPSAPRRSPFSLMTSAVLTILYPHLRARIR